MQRVAEDIACAFESEHVRVVGVSSEPSDDPRVRVVKQWGGRTGKVLTLVRYFAVALIELRARPKLVQAMTWRAALPLLVVRGREPLVLFCHGAELIRTGGGAPAAALRRAVLRRADAVVANSEYTASLVQQVGGRAATLTHPPLRALPANTDPKHDRTGAIRILSVGRLVPNKGHSRLITAMARMKAQGADVILTIAGAGADEFVLRQLIDVLGVADTVHLVGAVTDDELDRLYRDADIFALLSTPVAGEVEGWGIVFVEAASYGLPVVAGRSGGAAEAVDHGVTGVVVDDDEQAVDALLSFVDDAERRRSFGAAGRARVTQFLLPEFRSQLQAVYEKVAAGERL